MSVHIWLYKGLDLSDSYLSHFSDPSMYLFLLNYNFYHLIKISEEKNFVGICSWYEEDNIAM